MSDRFVAFCLAITVLAGCSSSYRNRLVATTGLEVVDSFQEMNERCNSLSGPFLVKGLLRGAAHGSNLVFFDDLANVDPLPAVLDPRSYLIDTRHLPAEDHEMLRSGPKNGGATGWWYLWRVEFVASLETPCAGKLILHRLVFLEAYPSREYERRVSEE